VAFLVVFDEQKSSIDEDDEIESHLKSILLWFSHFIVKIDPTNLIDKVEELKILAVCIVILCSLIQAMLKEVV
jgi:hypothetical protein